MIVRVAPVPSPALIVGESGTGKELVARELHRLGPNPKAPFVALNSAALPHELVEKRALWPRARRLHGRHRDPQGRLRGGQRRHAVPRRNRRSATRRPGEAAARARERKVTRIGANKTIDVDTRVVAATHHDLEKEVAEGRFREDLFYRLNVHVLRVPPLRDRLSDVPALVEHLVAATCERFGMKTKTVARTRSRR